MNEYIPEAQETGATQKTETYTQYAAYIKTTSGRWQKIHPFFEKSVRGARSVIWRHKRMIYPEQREYKIAARQVTITYGDWEVVE